MPYKRDIAFLSCVGSGRCYHMRSCAVSNHWMIARVIASAARACMICEAIVPEQDDLLGDPVQKCPVMGHDHNSSVFQSFQVPLKPQNTGQVQVICGLIL